MAPPDSEAGAFARPSPQEIRAAWKTLFSDPLLSLANLKAEAVGPGLGPAAADGGVLLRSLYWRLYFGLLPSPTSLELYPSALATARRAYTDLRERYLVAPDGRWAADCTGGEGYATASPKASVSTPWVDPLSLDGHNPWKAWFAHLDLRATIRQDVDRTFPDIPYFGLERVRRALTTMLFLFAVINPDVGYRQGMHELLAVCLVVVDRDSLVADPKRTPASPLSSSPEAVCEEAMVSTLDRAYVEHDAFQLFIQLMKPAKVFYEWRSEEGVAAPRISAAVAPIITRCSHIHGLLRRVDPQLWERLESEGVEPQIWAIRWIRLLFTRELPFSEALRLWDGMFAEDPALGMLDYVCLAMLLLIRNELIHADYPTLLTHLLHYPAPSATYPFKPSLILTQAKILQSNVSSAAGAEVVMENHELLGVKASGPDTSDAPLDPDALTPTSFFFGRGGTPSPRPGSSASRGKARAGMQGLAQGLFERAQKAGLDKAFMSTVNDLRSSLPDSTTAYSFLPSFSPSHTPGITGAAGREPGPYSSIPSSTSALPRPMFHEKQSDDAASISSAKSLLDAERQLAEMRLAMLGMGKAMTEWMEVLRDAESSKESESADVADAWKGLSRVRDTLLEAAGREVDELVKDWAWNDGLDTSRSRSSSAVPTPSSPSQPLPPPPPPPTRSPPTRSPPESDEPQITPKAQMAERFASPTKLPAPPPRTAASLGSGPQLHLSSRHDQPAASLTRTLYHPRPSSTSAAKATKRLSDSIALSAPESAHLSPPPSGTSFEGARLASPPVSPSPPAHASPDGNSMDMDPLAGIGVESIPLDARRRSAIFHGRGGGSASASGSGSGSATGSATGTATSPRMAVGSDPLGVHM